jgi:hypothetical protein
LQGNFTQSKIPDPVPFKTFTIQTRFMCWRVNSDDVELYVCNSQQLWGLYMVEDTSYEMVDDMHTVLD